MDELNERIKRDAQRTIVQCRKDLEWLTTRMKRLEGADPAVDDSYTGVSTSIKQVLGRINQVIQVAVKMETREITGIRPELN